MRALAFTLGVLLLAAGVTPIYPITAMALWIPGCGLVLVALYYRKDTHNGR